MAVTAFGAATASSYAFSGLVDWRLAGFFIAGGLIGGFAGVALGKVLADRRGALNSVFAVIVLSTGSYILLRGIMALG